MPRAVADLFELAVAVMLLLLGVRSIGRALRSGLAAHPGPCSRDSAHHVHADPVDHLHIGAWTMARGPLMIGLAHGLAGSGALTALALASMPSLGAGLVYMLSFAAGSAVGMALLTELADWPLRRMKQKANVEVALGAMAGVTSLVVGVLWGWPLVERLLRA